MSIFYFCPKLRIFFFFQKSRGGCRYLACLSPPCSRLSVSTNKISVFLHLTPRPVAFLTASNVWNPPLEEEFSSKCGHSLGHLNTRYPCYSLNSSSSSFLFYLLSRWYWSRLEALQQARCSLLGPVCTASSNLHSRARMRLIWKVKATQSVVFSLVTG